MRILIIGSGGREHALAWKLLQTSDMNDGRAPDPGREIFVAPGNGGTAALAHNVEIAATDIPGLVDFATSRAIDLTVVGPEVPLVMGVVDAFQAAGLRAFGPTAAAARLEGSKAFAKEFMLREGMPTAPTEIFDDYEAARAALDRHVGPIVVKASGLAAGKGVLICNTRDEAQSALHQIMVERAFGAAGDRVLLEARLEGEEVSLLAFSDGTTVVPMPAARDYKRALDGDRGLNTGGMGGYAPSPYLTPKLVDRITDRILQPVIDGMRRRGTPYVGVLYAGLMLTAEGPQVLEFNVRFGDPETQLLMPLLETDLAEVMLACLDGHLAELALSWRPGYSVGVVLASGGYPGAYEKGKAITGLDDAARIADTIFHAGTQREGGHVLTDGGRVLAVIATEPTLEAARSQVYAAVGRIKFEGMHYRTDIALSGGQAEAEDRSPIESSPSSAYAAAGVDIDAGERAVALMKAAVRRTYTPDVLTGIGAFGGSLSVRESRQGQRPCARRHD